MTEGDPDAEGRRVGRLAKFGAAVIAALVFLLIAAVGLPHLLRALDIDSCLDRGGRWNAEQEKCEGAETPGSGGSP